MGARRRGCRKKTEEEEVNFHFSPFFLFSKKNTMPPHHLSSSTPTAAASAPFSSSFLPADRRAARRGLWRDWVQAPEQGSLLAVVDQRPGRDGGSAAAAVSEWATAWLAASTAESDLTSMLHNEVMVRGRVLGFNEAERRKRKNKVF